MVASIIWKMFGAVNNVVDPFMGSLAILWARPDWQPGAFETVNDADGHLVNAFRAIHGDPEATAHYAAYPVSECDLHARHAYLVGRREDITARLCGDPEWFDAKAAGWWIWGQCCWIAGGWCSGNGPWHVVDGRLVNDGGAERMGGIHRQLPALFWGQGIHRKRPHLLRGIGIHRNRPVMDDRRQDRESFIREWFQALSHRLADVRICCGDWTLVLGPTPTTELGLTAVLLDPPYGVLERDDCYVMESRTVAADVREWAIAHGDDPLLRIALCGYDGEHAMPEGWTPYRWKTQGGYGNQGNGNGRNNSGRETIWFSPHCLRDDPAQKAFVWGEASTDEETQNERTDV